MKAIINEKVQALNFPPKKIKMKTSGEFYQPETKKNIIYRAELMPDN